MGLGGNLLLEVELQRHSQLMLDLYRTEYKNRYGLDPVIPNITYAMTVFKDVIRASNLHTALSLVSFYLKSNGEQDWYKRQSHNLSTFSDNVERLNGQWALEQSAHNPTQSSRGVKVSLPHNCLRCHNSFLLECYGDELDTFHTCPKCTAQNRQVRQTSLEAKPADPDFVSACLQLLSDKMTGKITKNAFFDGCSLLDEAANHIMQNHETHQTPSSTQSGNATLSHLGTLA